MNDRESAARKTIPAEDYLEPACPLCMDPSGKRPVQTVPQGRIMEKLDEYMAHRDLAGAERHLLYWLQESQILGDERGELLVRGELMGHYRKVQKREEAMEQTDAAFRLIARLGMEETVSEATVCVNAATVYDAFGDPGRAIPYFERARVIYEANLPENDGRLGGLYNNMGLALAEERRFGEAYEAFQRALRIADARENSALERAMTELNIANAVEAEHGLERGAEKIEQCLDAAQAQFDREDVIRDGYYAFVCEKCAPTFSYYGYFAFAEELNERAEKIYAGA